MQNTVDNPECSAVVGQSFVTEPINVGNFLVKITSLESKVDNLDALASQFSVKGEVKVKYINKR